MRLIKKDLQHRRAGDITIFVFLLFGAAFMAVPILYAIVNSLKPLNELWIFPPRLYVSNPTLDNFRDLFRIMQNSLVPFTKYLFNTVLITVLGTFGNVLLGSMCAYGLSKRNFHGKNLMFALVVYSLMFNATVTAIPNFMIVSWLGLMDTQWALIIPAFGSSLGLYLMKQFVDQVPDTLLEAAAIDGASEWRKYWSIVMPTVKAAWMTVIVFSVQGLWNTGTTNMIFREEIKPLGMALNQAMASGAISRAGVSAAVTVVMMIVPVGVFLFTQSQIIETMTASGIKE